MRPIKESRRSPATKVAGRFVRSDQKRKRPVMDRPFSIDGYKCQAAALAGLSIGFSAEAGRLTGSALNSGRATAKTSSI